MSQTLSRMFYKTLMKNTLPGYITSDSKDSDSKKGQSSDSSESDSEDSFSDSESMESRSIQDSQDSSRSLGNMESRDIWEYLKHIASIDNDRLNTRRLNDELDAIVSRSSNAGGVPMDKREDMGSEDRRDMIPEDWGLGKMINKRAITSEKKERLASLKTTRRGSDINKLIRKRFRLALDVALNDNMSSEQDAWADAIFYFLKKRYLEDDQKTTRQDTDGENVIKKDEARIAAAIFGDIFKRDTGFNSENEDNQRHNRALDSPNSPDVEKRFDPQGVRNDVAHLDKRQQNKDGTPAVATAPNKETSTKVTKPNGGTQAGPLPTTVDKKNRYLLCKCLPGK